MLKDREQKARALQLAVANRWFPQLEVQVGSGPSLAPKPATVTDLDVFAVIPDQFSGYRSVVFDCKTKAKESAVNRSLWLLGVMERMGAEQGFCILKRGNIDVDHRLMAARHGVILLSETEFELYGRVTSAWSVNSGSHIDRIESWERVSDTAKRFPTLRQAVAFSQGAYWMIEDSAEACRKTLAMLRSLHGELDPAQESHIALFLDLCSLFTKSLATVICHVFKAYLHPSSQSELSEALLLMLYGGREAYQYRNELYKIVRSKSPDVPAPDLSLPEWNLFLRLARQLLDAPLALLQVPLILRELGFAVLNGGQESQFARALCAETPQAARFALLIPSYLVRAAQLPPEFASRAEEMLLELQPVK